MIPSVVLNFLELPYSTKHRGSLTFAGDFSKMVYVAACSQRCCECRVKEMKKQTISIKLLFFAVLELAIKRFEAAKIDPQLLLAILPPAMAYQLRSEGVCKLMDLFRANSPLTNALNWYEFGLLTKMVNKFGDPDLELELRFYILILKLYLQSRRITEEQKVTTTSVSNSDLKKASKVRVLVDPEWDEGLVKFESKERSFLASLLGTTWNRLSFTEDAK